MANHRRKVSLPRSSPGTAIGQELKQRWSFFKSLGEGDRLRYAALEAPRLGHGRIAYISQLSNASP